MKIAVAKRKPVEINLVPLLDSIFILVFFFMFSLATMVKRQGLSVALPGSSSGKSITERQSLSVKKDGSLFWGQELIKKEELSLKLNAFKKNSPDTALVIQGDRGTAFENIVEILDTAKRLGVSKVTIETKGQSGGGN